MQRIIKRNRERKLCKDKYISGFLPKDKILPVITTVIYYGSEPWDGPRSLHEMFNIPRRYLRFIPNYKINIIEPAILSDKDLKKFKSSMREVLTAIKYSSDNEKLEKVLMENENFEHIDPMAADVIEIVTDVKIKDAIGEDGTINMCKAFDDHKKRGIEEGKDVQAKETALRLHEKNMSDEKIAEIVNRNVEVIKEWLYGNNK